LGPYSEPYPGLAGYHSPTEATYPDQMNHRQPPENTELYINPSLLELNHESAVAHPLGGSLVDPAIPAHRPVEEYVSTLFFCNPELNLLGITTQL